MTDDSDDESETPSADIERKLIESLKERLPSGPVEPEVLAETIASFLTVEVRKLVHFQGPLPPPEMLSEYEAVQPGLADRIVARADKEQEFRHEMGRGELQVGKAALWHQAIHNYLGQLSALAIALSAIGGGVYLISNGKDAEGLATIIGALAAIVVAFITGKIAESKNSSGDS